MRPQFISNVIMCGSLVVDQSMAFCWSWLLGLLPLCGFVVSFSEDLLTPLF
jgi:hypothetical protein